MILDPDVFPLGPVSLIERLRGVDAAGRVARGEVLSEDAAHRCAM